MASKSNSSKKERLNKIAEGRKTVIAEYTHFKQSEGFAHLEESIQPMLDQVRPEETFIVRLRINVAGHPQAPKDGELAFPCAMGRLEDMLLTACRISGFLRLAQAVLGTETNRFSVNVNHMSDVYDAMMEGASEEERQEFTMYDFLLHYCMLMSSYGDDIVSFIKSCKNTPPEERDMLMAIMDTHRLSGVTAVNLFGSTIHKLAGKSIRVN